MAKPDEMFVLCEVAAGYLLVYVKEWDAIAASSEEYQRALESNHKLKKLIEARAWVAFGTAEEALKNQQAICDGTATDFLIVFLKQNLPKKLKHVRIGVADSALGRSLSAQDFPVFNNTQVLEILRLCREKIHFLVPSYGQAEERLFQVALGHAASRSTLKDDPRRNDKSVQQAVALIETIDKSLNKFAMRVKEWYGWHFPELAKIVPDNVKFAELTRVIKNKDEFDFDVAGRKKLLKHLDGSEELVDEIVHASKVSMGQEIAEIDLQNIQVFSKQVQELAQERTVLATYLSNKMDLVAPNVKVLVGEIMGAKLISQSGSLTNLAKSPSSTVQILGAEKALFRALKTRGKTPKYGLLFQNSWVGRASFKNKGRIARCLANKLSICARIDAFALPSADTPINTDIGRKLHEQVEDRLLRLTRTSA